MKKAFSLIIPIILIVTLLTACLTSVDKEAINDVTNLIGAIGNVSKDSDTKIEAAERAFNGLDIKLQQRVENANLLSNAKIAYDILLANEVIKSISNIGVVTIESKKLIDLASDRFNSLSDAQKAYVNNSTDLLKAKETYNQLLADRAIAEINSIGLVTNSSKPKIDLAFEVYTSLSDEQKALVGNIDLLLNSEGTYNQLKADDVIKLIDKIADVTLSDKEVIDYAKQKYDSLTRDQQKLITNYEKIQSSYDELSKLEIANVIELINIIGEVDINSSPAIDTAKRAYDSLIPAQQAFVTTYPNLEESIKEFSTAQVNDVIQKINAIGNVTLESKPKVVEARAAYVQLSSNQEKEVINYTLLESSESEILKLEVAAINKYLVGINLNYLQASDESKLAELESVYNKLPVGAKKEIQNPEKIKQALDIFKNYNLAKDLAAGGHYEGAYNLMVELNYLDSKSLTRKYEKEAFRWRVEGGMYDGSGTTEDFYERWDIFKAEFTFMGGKEGEKINVLVICYPPNSYSGSEVYYDVTNGYKGYFQCWNPDPFSSSTGIGTIKFTNYSTGEDLGYFEFMVE